MNIFLLVILLFCRLGTMQAYSPPSLFTKDQEPKAELLELLKICDIPYDGNNLVEQTQAYWYQGGKERWEFDDRYSSYKREMIPLLYNLNVLQEIKPPIQEYDYALVHGALLKRVRMRLQNLIQAWKSGVRFKKIVFLTGDRPLHPTYEDGFRLLDEKNEELPFSPNFTFHGDLPTNEYEMMQLVYKQADMPKEMRQIPVQWVNAPKVNNRRPDTSGTLKEWLKTSPEPGSCLAISNQPYVGYQHAVIQSNLPKEFTLVTVGPVADVHTSIPIHLDNLAKWIYISHKSN